MPPSRRGCGQGCPKRKDDQQPQQCARPHEEAVPLSPSRRASRRRYPQSGSHEHRNQTESPSVDGSDPQFVGQLSEYLLERRWSCPSSLCPSSSQDFSQGQWVLGAMRYTIHLINRVAHEQAALFLS